jgi:molecular chaperone GrpE
VVTEPAPAAPAAPAANANAGETALLRQEIERLNALLEEKERLAREADARASESAEEVERAKERLRKEAARELQQHKREVVLGFIDVLDDLDRAAKAAQGESDAAAMREGVELVRKNFQGKLAQLGVEHAPALGERFDPARHEAVSMLPIRDPAQDGLVVAVAREGYRMGDDVIRPARVVVARAS